MAAKIRNKLTSLSPYVYQCGRVEVAEELKTEHKQISSSYRFPLFFREGWLDVPTFLDNYDYQYINYQLIYFKSL